MPDNPEGAPCMFDKLPGLTVLPVRPIVVAPANRMLRRKPDVTRPGY